MKPRRLGRDLTLFPSRGPVRLLREKYSIPDATSPFDLACWFSGTAAEQAAAEDGQESPPPNDYYIRNVNSTLRTVPVTAGAEVNWLPSTGDPATATTVEYVTWLDERQSRDFQPGVWLTLADGMVTFVEEQYVP